AGIPGDVPIGHAVMTSVTQRGCQRTRLGPASDIGSMVRNGNYIVRSGWQTGPVSDWHVLLVGGPSGCGKSTVCAELMRRFGVGCSDLDDINAAVQAMTTPEQQPWLHHWDRYGASREWTAPEILDVTLRVAEAMAPAIRAVVDTHLDNGP